MRFTMTICCLAQLLRPSILILRDPRVLQFVGFVLALRFCRRIYAKDFRLWRGDGRSVGTIITVEISCKGRSYLWFELKEAFRHAITLLCFARFVANPGSLDLLSTCSS